jgi:hypothetical protein
MGRYGTTEVVAEKPFRNLIRPSAAKAGIHFALLRRG